MKWFLIAVIWITNISMSSRIIFDSGNEAGIWIVVFTTALCLLITHQLTKGLKNEHRNR